MRVYLNNNLVKAGSVEVSLLQLFKQLDLSVEGCAVALNGSVIPRGLWSKTLLNEGDEISLFQVIAGG